jgi:hypothetical protein
MWNPVELPFKCDSSPPLPTVDEIWSCSDVIQRRSAKKVVAINDKVVAKFGGGIDIAEGQALISWSGMLMVSQHRNSMPCFAMATRSF